MKVLLIMMISLKLFWVVRSKITSSKINAANLGNDQLIMLADDEKVIIPFTFNSIHKKHGIEINSKSEPDFLEKYLHLVEDVKEFDFPIKIVAPNKGRFFSPRKNIKVKIWRAKTIFILFEAEGRSFLTSAIFNKNNKEVQVEIPVTGYIAESTERCNEHEINVATLSFYCLQSEIGQFSVFDLKAMLKRVIKDESSNSKINNYKALSLNSPDLKYTRLLVFVVGGSFIWEITFQDGFVVDVKHIIHRVSNLIEIKVELLSLVTLISKDDEGYKTFYFKLNSRLEIITKLMFLYNGYLGGSTISPKSGVARFYFHYPVDKLNNDLFIVNYNINESKLVSIIPHRFDYGHIAFSPVDRCNVITKKDLLFVICPRIYLTKGTPYTTVYMCNSNTLDCWFQNGLYPLPSFENNFLLIDNEIGVVSISSADTFSLGYIFGMNNPMFVFKGDSSKFPTDSDYPLTKIDITDYSNAKGKRVLYKFKFYYYQQEDFGSELSNYIFKASDYIKDVTLENPGLVHTIVIGSYKAIKLVEKQGIELQLQPYTKYVDYFTYYAKFNRSGAYDHLISHSFFPSETYHMQELGLDQAELIFLLQTMNDNNGYLFVKYKMKTSFWMYQIELDGKVTYKGNIFDNINPLRIVPSPSGLIILDSNLVIHIVNIEYFTLRQVRYTGERCKDLAILENSNLPAMVLCYIKGTSLTLYLADSFFSINSAAEDFLFQLIKPHITTFDNMSADLLYSASLGNYFFLFFKEKGISGESNIIIGKVMSGEEIIIDLQRIESLLPRSGTFIGSGSIADVLIVESYLAILYICKSQETHLLVYFFNERNEKFELKLQYSLDSFISLIPDSRLYSMKTRSIVEKIGDTIDITNILIHVKTDSSYNVLVIDPYFSQMDSICCFLLPIDSLRQFKLANYYIMDRVQISTSIGVIFGADLVDDLNVMFQKFIPSRASISSKLVSTIMESHSLIKESNINSFKPFKQEFTFYNRRSIFIGEKIAEITRMINFKPSIVPTELRSISNLPNPLVWNLERKRLNLLYLDIHEQFYGNIYKLQMSPEIPFDAISNQIQIVNITSYESSIEIVSEANENSIFKTTCQEGFEDCLYYLQDEYRSILFSSSGELFKKANDNNLPGYKLLYHNSNCVYPLFMSGYLITICISAEGQSYFYTIHLKQLTIVEFPFGKYPLNKSNFQLEFIGRNRFAVKIKNNDLYFEVWVVEMVFPGPTFEIGIFRKSYYTKVIFQLCTPKTVYLVYSNVIYDSVNIQVLRIDKIGTPQLEIDRIHPMHTISFSSEVMNNNRELLEIGRIEKSPFSIFFIPILVDDTAFNSRLYLIPNDTISNAPDFKLSSFSLSNPFAGLKVSNNLPPLCLERVCVLSSIFKENSYLRIYYLSQDIVEVAEDRYMKYIDNFTKNGKDALFKEQEHMLFTISILNYTEAFLALNWDYSDFSEDEISLMVVFKSRIEKIRICSQIKLMAMSPQISSRRVSVLAKGFFNQSQSVSINIENANGLDDWFDGQYLLISVLVAGIFMGFAFILLKQQETQQIADNRKRRTRIKNKVKDFTRANFYGK